MKYINCRTSEGIETLSCIDRKEFKRKTDYLKEIVKQVFCYRQSGHDAYVSQRATKDWYQR